MAQKAFSGGAALEKRLAEMARKVKNASALRVGVPEGKTYPNGTPVAMVAAIQEFGAPRAGIPPRAHIRPMIERESPHWGDKLAALLKAFDMDARKALAILGDDIAGEWRQAIIDLEEPALSKVTLMLRKMRSENQGLVMSRTVVEEARRRVEAGEDPGLSGTAAKPLVDRGVYLDSITPKVS